MGAHLYILRCADGSYYVGTTAAGLERRLAEHQAGDFDGYTALRRPVELVFHEHFDRLEDAAAAERQVKGWRREKNLSRRDLVLSELADWLRAHGRWRFLLTAPPLRLLSAVGAPANAIATV